MPRPRRRKPAKPTGERILLPDGRNALLFTRKEYQSLKPPLPTSAQIIHAGKNGVVVEERRGAKTTEKASAVPEKWRIQQAIDLVERLRRTGWGELEIRMFLKQHGYPWPEKN